MTHLLPRTLPRTLQAFRNSSLGFRPFAASVKAPLTPHIWNTGNFSLNKRSSLTTLPSAPYSDYTKAMTKINTISAEPPSPPAELEHSRKLGIMRPRHIEKSLSDLSLFVMEQILGPRTKNHIVKLLDLSQESLTNPLKVSELEEYLSGIPQAEFRQILKAAATHLQIINIEAHATRSAATPLKSILETICAQYDIPTILTFIPHQKTDVTTTHPVVVMHTESLTHQQGIREVGPQWIKGKRTYDVIPPEYKQEESERLNTQSDQLIEHFIHLYTVSHVKPTKVSPIEEQGTIAHIIKSSEIGLSQGTARNNRLMQLALLRKIASTIPSEHHLLDIADEESQLHALTESKAIQKHPKFEEITQFGLNYSLHRWILDTDGTTLVTWRTAFTSLAQSKISILDDLSKLPIFSIPDDKIPPHEKQRMNKRLKNLSATQDPEWLKLIKSLEDRKATLTEKYAQLLHFRFNQAKGKALYFLEDPEHRNTDLLRYGISDATQLLKLLDPLANCEKALGIKGGQWTRAHSLAKMRGLFYGRELHARKGQNFHEIFVSELLHATNPAKFPTKESYLSASPEEKKVIRATLLENDVLPSELFIDTLSPEIRTIFENYQQFFKIVPDATLIQSDSAPNGDILEASEILKIMAKYAGQDPEKGTLFLLCEDGTSMPAAQSFLSTDEKRIFSMPIGNLNDAIKKFYELNAMTLTINGREWKVINDTVGFPTRKLLIQNPENPSENHLIKVKYNSTKTLQTPWGNFSLDSIACTRETIKIMTPGSDGPKQVGPLYAGAISYDITQACRGEGFNGIGDSVERSANHRPLVSRMQTIQPGTLVESFLLGNPTQYVIGHSASNIEARMEESEIKATLDTSISKTIFQIIGEETSTALIEGRESLHAFFTYYEAMGSMSSNNISRPAKKAKPREGQAITDSFTMLQEVIRNHFVDPSIKGNINGYRMIEFVRNQIFANNFDGLLVNIKPGIESALRKLHDEHGINLETIHETFNKHPLGKALLKDIAGYAQAMDPDISPIVPQKTTPKDLADIYQLLSGRPMPLSEQSPYVRLGRLLFKSAVERECSVGEVTEAFHTLSGLVTP